MDSDVLRRARRQARGWWGLLLRPLLLLLLPLLLTSYILASFTFSGAPAKRSGRLQNDVGLPNFLIAGSNYSPGQQAADRCVTMLGVLEQASVDKYLEGHCDSIHISRAVRVVNSLQAFPQITQRQVDSGWQNLCWGWSNEEIFAGYKFAVEKCHLGIRVQILDNKLYFTPAPLNHSNFQDLNYLYQKETSILDENTWFEAGAELHNDRAFYDRSWPRYAMHALTSLQQLLAKYDVPDTDFVLSFASRCAPVNYQTLPQGRAPMMSWSLRDDNYGQPCNALVLPMYDYTWSYQDFKVGSNWRVDSYPEVPWKDKDPRVVWRGTLTAREPRARALKFGLMRPDLVDIKHTGPIDECKSIYHEEVQKFGGPLGENDCLDATTEVSMTAGEIIRYKYLLDIEGHGPTFRLKNLLLSNSVVFKLQEEGMQWFYPDLKAYVHYVPVSVNDFELDLEKKIAWARHHDDVVRQIGERASAFVQQYIDNDSMSRFQLLTLSLYASRQIFVPTKHPLAKLMCCKDLRGKQGNKELENLLKRCRERLSTTELCIGDNTRA